jgi:hypothetical protein
MSSALKRRFNFETVRPIRDRDLERRLIAEQTSGMLAQAEIDTRLAPDVVDLLVTAFHDLRDGVTDDGVVVEKPTAVLPAAGLPTTGDVRALAARCQVSWPIRRPGLSSTPARPSRAWR